MRYIFFIVRYVCLLSFTAYLFFCCRVLPFIAVDLFSCFGIEFSDLFVIVELLGLYFGMSRSILFILVVSKGLSEILGFERISLLFSTNFVFILSAVFSKIAQRSLLTPRDVEWQPSYTILALFHQRGCLRLGVDSENAILQFPRHRGTSFFFPSSL